MIGSPLKTNIMPDKFVKPSHTDSRFAIVGVLVVVADVEEKIPVIEDANTGKLSV